VQKKRLKNRPEMPEMTKWQSALLVCHAKSAKKGLAHLLMEKWLQKLKS